MSAVRDLPDFNFIEQLLRNYAVSESYVARGEFTVAAIEEQAENLHAWIIRAVNLRRALVGLTPTPPATKGQGK